MADEPNSFYPPDFPVELANVVRGCHTLDAQRITSASKKNKIVARLNLKLGDEPTPHGKDPDMTCEEIAADLWGKIEADAKAHCKGFAKYKIVATYSKPKQGPTPEPASFEIECGDAPLLDRDGKVRDEILSECQTLLHARHREYLELARETTKLATAVGTMATGLAGAWSSVHESRAKGNEHVLEMKMLDNEREAERERIRMFQATVIPMLRMIQGKGSTKPTKDDGSGKPEIVQVARKLGRSLDENQLQAAAKLLGADRLRELRDVDEAADVMAIGAWLIGHENTEALYNELREDQAPLVLRLQELLVAGGAAHETEKRALAAGE